MSAINEQKKIQEKGFTILFAVLVSILVLAVGASIVNLSLKQILLSGSARESQFAFYAANTGVECALYWNTQNLPGKDGLVFVEDDDDSSVFAEDEVQCLGDKLSDTDGALVSSNSDGASTRFRLDFDYNDNDIVDSGELPYCVDVIVTKEKNILETDVDTTIQAYGYNTCDESNPRRIERGLRLDL